MGFCLLVLAFSEFYFVIMIPYMSDEINWILCLTSGSWCEQFEVPIESEKQTPFSACVRCQRHFLCKIGFVTIQGGSVNYNSWISMF